MGNEAINMISKGYTFLFAYEVEIGFLIGDISFDKDGRRGRKKMRWGKGGVSFFKQGE